MAREDNLLKNTRDINTCTGFEISHVEVSIIFSAHRFFRHAGMDVMELSVQLLAMATVQDKLLGQEFSEILDWVRQDSAKDRR